MLRDPFSSLPVVSATSADGTRLGIFGVQPDGPIRLVSPDRARPPLLLVHGATADHTTWRAVGPSFARSSLTFAVDRRGRGASGDGAAYAIEREFEDIAAGAEAIAGETGAPAIDVVGHSYGGRAALGASLRTEAVRRVVVYEGAPAPPGVSYRPEGLITAVREALDRGDNERALETFLEGIVGMSDAELADYRANPVWSARVEAAPTILREIEAETSPAASLDALGLATDPVLLILGSASRSPFRLGTDALAARLARGEVAVIEGAAHAAHHTHPAEFVRVVETFLDRFGSP